MQALVSNGPGRKNVEGRPKPTITLPGQTARSGRIDAKQLITHRFKFDKILDAYDTFAHAADTKALRIIEA